MKREFPLYIEILELAERVKGLLQKQEELKAEIERLEAILKEDQQKLLMENAALRRTLELKPKI